jgi:hypothetical protein
MGDTVNGETRVIYTVKELLGEIRVDVKEIKAALSTKADRSELLELRLKIDNEVDKRLAALEADDTAIKAVTNYRRFFWPIVISVSLSLVFGLLNLGAQMLKLIHA